MEIENQLKEKNKSKMSVITQPEVLYETAHEYANKVASTGLGQFAITKIDQVLSTIEKTAKWSLPQTEQTPNADKNIPSPALDRPLPWIPFLATIVVLRALRISLSFAAILIGNEPISASSVVYFIQTRRRKLRCIKHNGLRIIREKQQEAEEKHRQGLIDRITAVFGGILCRPDQHQDAYVKIIYKKNKKSRHGKGKGRKSTKALLNSEGGVEDDTNNMASGSNVQSNENNPLDMLYQCQDDDSDESDFTLEEDDTTLDKSEISSISENTEQMEERYRQMEEDLMENNKKILEEMIQQKGEQLENDIKSKLESQIEQRIEEHALALNAKLDEKIEEIQGIHEQQQQQEQEQNLIHHHLHHHQNNQIPDNPSSVAINPPKMSPQIAQNGNIDDENDNSRITPNDHKDNKGSPEFERIFENHSSVQDIIKKREELNLVESNLPFIENEIKTNLQINLKQSNAKKFHSSSNPQPHRIRAKK